MAFRRATTEKPHCVIDSALCTNNCARTTHDQEDWFVPVSIAVDGLTAEQAMWSPGKGDHSVGQLAYHFLNNGFSLFTLTVGGGWAF